MAWKHCIKFPWCFKISRRTCHQAFSFWVISLCSLCICFLLLCTLCIKFPLYFGFSVETQLKLEPCKPLEPRRTCRLCCAMTLHVKVTFLGGLHHNTLLHVSSRSDPVACLTDVLHWDLFLGPSESRVSSNVVVARHTVSCFLHFVWTEVLLGGSTGEIILWTRVQSTWKTIPRTWLIRVSISHGLPPTTPQRLSKPASCAAMIPSPRTLDIASMCWSPDFPAMRSLVRNSHSWKLVACACTRFSTIPSSSTQV